MNIPNKTPIQTEQMFNIAFEAGLIMNQYFKHFNMDREVKSDDTPLTIADTKINRLVIDRVREISPSVDIVGEEESDRTDSPWQIVCDPIDGTFPFTWGMPISTFMLGLTYEGIPVMGVIYDPFTERIYHAEKGKGALMNNKVPLKVSTIHKSGDRPIVGCVSWPGCPYNMLDVCKYLEDRGINSVNFLSVGYVEAAVATGELAGSIFPSQKYHDTVPGHIIVEEAGGVVTNLFGKSQTYLDDEIEGHIMSNQPIHDILVEAVKYCN